MVEQTHVFDEVATFAEPLQDSMKKGFRYYAGICAPYLFEPTSDRVMVVSTVDKGEGLIALKQYAQGEVVFRFYGNVRHEQTLYTLQRQPGVYVEDPYVMGKVLHSCEPNMVCHMDSQTFTALRTIDHGEPLTMDYETTEDELYRSFNCGCGSPLCRGYIRGRKRSNGSVEQG